MSIGKFEFSDSQRRWIFAIAIALISATFIPFLSGYVDKLLMWGFGNTGFTVGTLLAIISLYGAYLMLPQPLGPRSL